MLRKARRQRGENPFRKELEIKEGPNREQDFTTKQKPPENEGYLDRDTEQAISRKLR